jgi:hypothetical protein
MKTRLIPFVFAIDDTALLELTSNLLRIWIDDALVSLLGESATYTRGEITNGEFTASIAGWTDESDTGGAIAWVNSGTKYLGLTGDGTDAGAAEQLVAVTTGGGITVGRHALVVVVAAGPVSLRIGTATGLDDIVGETALDTGTHTVTFTPTGSFYLQFLNRAATQALVDSAVITVVPAGDAQPITVPTPWAEADLENLRWAQSGDVIFVACKNKQQYRIERRAADSWSVVQYRPADGPFRIENVSTTTLTPGALTGNTTLTASKPIFKSGHLGSLWKVSSSGQKVTEVIAAQNTFSDPIRVTSIGDARQFSIIITGTWVATVTLQRSVGEVGAWEDLTTYTANEDTTYKDVFDNQIIFYRLGVKTGAYTSGTVTVSLNYSSGSITGIARATAFTSSTVLQVEVLKDFGGTEASDVWAEGLWSDYRGWPSAVALHDGRLWWAGKDKFVGSVVDAFDSFDETLEGDAAPISRSIGFGPVDSINWLLSLSRLVAGTATREIGCRSSTFDEPLTPTNFTPKQSGSQGSAPLQALEIDNQGVFLQRGKWRLYELAFSLEKSDYTETDLTQMCPEYLSPGVVAMAVQRQPDTRIHCVRSDGTVGVLVFDRTENLLCWMEVTTNGDVEEVAVLPTGGSEDAVYYVIRRTVAGQDYRYIERWAKETDCRGGSANLQADSFVYQAASSDTITGLDHLEGYNVVVWAEGADRGVYTVTGGQVQLDAAYTDRMAGLYYMACWKSAKLAYIAPPGKSALSAPKRINQLGLVLADTHPDGVYFGQDFIDMDPLPLMENGVEVDPDAVWANLEARMISFPGTWHTDARLCLTAEAPKPATIMAAVIDMDSNS